MIRRRMIMIFAAACLWPVGAGAEISEPSKIPSYLSGRDDLAVQQSTLVLRWNALRQKIGDQNAQCGQIAEDSPWVDTCRSNQAAILSDIKSYKDDLRRYEETLANAPNPSPHDNLLLMHERILRDLHNARELRGRAMLQKQRLQRIPAGAPAGIEHAERVLAQTEASIKDLEVRLGWTEHAIKNLDSSMKPKKNYDPKYDLGFGMVLQQPAMANVQVLHAGHDSTEPLGDDQFLPGDQIITDTFGRVKLSSLGSSNYTLDVGPQTRIKLEQEHRDNGTVWSLSEGIVHCAPLIHGVKEAPARVRTPDSVVQGDPNSEFDVRINEKGETAVEVYRGRVEVQEPTKGTSYFIDSKISKLNPAPWWKQSS